MKITMKGLIFPLVLSAAVSISLYKYYLDSKTKLYLYRYPAPQTEFTSYAKEFESLKKFYEKRIKNAPNNFHDRAVLAHYYLGAAREISQEDYYNYAAKYALQSLYIMPRKNSMALKVLADLALARHEFKKAAVYGTSLLKAEPRSPEAHIVLINSNLSLGELKEANHYSDNFVQIYPSEVSYTMRAIVLGAQGRYEEALVDFNQAFVLEEEDIGQAVSTRNAFGKFCMDVGNETLAEKVLKEALRLNPKSSQTLFNLGELYLKKKDPEEAAKYFKGAFKESKQLTYLYAEARAYKEKGDLTYSSNLISQIERLLREDLKRNRKAYNAADLIRLLLERGNPKDNKEGLYLAREEIKKRTGIEMLLLLAWANEKNNNLLEARKNIREILSKNIRSPELFIRAASIEEKLKNPTLADLYYKQASIDLSQPNKTVWY